MQCLLRWMGLVLLLILLPVLMGGCRGSESQAEPGNNQDSVKAVKVDVVEVKPAPIQDVLVLPGETEAWQDVLVAADKDGRVEWIGPREGDVVKKGQPMADLVNVDKIKIHVNVPELDVRHLKKGQALWSPLMPFPISV